MKNLDILIFTSIVIICFVSFIVSTFREFESLAKKGDYLSKKKRFSFQNSSIFGKPSVRLKKPCSFFKRHKYKVLLFTYTVSSDEKLIPTNTYQILPSLFACI